MTGEKTSSESPLRPLVATLRYRPIPKMLMHLVSTQIRVSLRPSMPKRKLISTSKCSPVTSFKFPPPLYSGLGFSSTLMKVPYSCPAVVPGTPDSNLGGTQCVLFTTYPKFREGCPLDSSLKNRIKLPLIPAVLQV